MKHLYQISVLSFTIYFLMFSKSYAQQNETYRPSKVISPSPTAASLGQYGNISVGYYSGNADINIPLYNLTTSNHSVPVTMRYNYTGTRVNEVASWVGLGWSLSAGGVITRTVIGLDDFGNNGFYHADALPPINNDDNSNYFYDISNGFKDGEPDIFNYNFGKYSGRFVLGKKNDGSPILMADQNNLKISYLESTNKWLIITPDGYKYYLGTHEYVDDYFFDSENVEVSQDAPLSAFTRNINSSPITSWYLDSISSPNSEVVKFNYLVKSNSLSSVNRSEAYYRLLTQTKPCGGNPVEFTGVKKTYNANIQVIHDVYLTSIQSNLGSIEFNTSDRDDIKYVSTTKPQKLSEIVVKNSNGVILRRFDFSYDYFSLQQLKLNSITEYGQTGVSKAPYTFTYNAPNGLPSIYSYKSIDHWGYYNDKSNQSLLPSFLIPSSPPSSFESADRQSVTDDEVIKKGILTSVTYPTGGSTVYDYEMNEYKNLKGEDRYTYTSKSAQVYDYPPSIPGGPIKSFETFTLTDTIAVTLNYNFIQADENANSLEGLQSTYGDLRKAGQISPLFTFEVWNCASYSSLYCSSAQTSPESITLVLLPGVYTLSIMPLQGYITSANAFWNEKTRIYQKKAAGLRIKSITNYINSVKIDTRKFIYSEAGTTTGRLINQPTYDYPVKLIATPPASNCAVIADYIALMSNSIYTYGLSPTTIIGYDKVTELFGENGENGKNEYFFFNIENALPKFPFIPTNGSPLNGKLYRQVNYTSNGAVLKKVDYLYDIKETLSLNGVKLYHFPPANIFPSDLVLELNYYSNQSHWVVLSKETETHYEGIIPIAKVKNYFFDNVIHKELTREELITSSEKIKSTVYKYPHDILPATAVSLKLIADWKIATVLEQSQAKGTVTNKFNNQFSLNWAPLSLLESVISTNTIDNTNESRLRYHAYDNKGNILSVSQEGGPKTCYIWGYGGQYPIAKIENADYNLILSALDGPAKVNSFRDKLYPSDAELIAFLSKLRTDPSFTKAFVSTYTYEPLVGMTSETDPKGITTYYEYDDFQRLKYVKDQQRNIIKSQDYHYKP